MSFSKSLQALTILIASLLTLLDAVAATLTIVPSKPKPHEVVRLQVGFGNGPKGPLTVTMKGNQIVVVDPMHGFILPSVGSMSEAVLGRFPAGEYEVVLAAPGFQPTQPPIRFVVEGSAVDAAGLSPQYDWTDLWWNPDESGWGMNITIKGAAFFGAWFTYDSEGKAVWYTLQGGSWLPPADRKTARCYSAPIIRTFGGPATVTNGLGSVANLKIATVGGGTICFNGYDGAFFTYEIDGVSGAKNIVRQPF
jgi:hypothetical protein